MSTYNNLHEEDHLSSSILFVLQHISKRSLQVDGAVDPLGKFLLVKSAAAEEVTKAARPVPGLGTRNGNVRSQSGDSLYTYHM